MPISCGFDVEHPLARCPTERSASNEALRIYYGLGTVRSLRQVAAKMAGEQTGKRFDRCYNRCLNWSSKYQWALRCERALELELAKTEGKRTELQLEWMDKLLINIFAYVAEEGRKGWESSKGPSETVIKEAGKRPKAGEPGEYSKVQTKTEAKRDGNPAFLSVMLQAGEAIKSLIGLNHPGEGGAGQVTVNSQTILISNLGKIIEEYGGLKRIEAARDALKMQLTNKGELPGPEEERNE